MSRSELGAYHRSTMSAGKAVVVVLISLLLGGLLNVTSLTQAAERQNGVGRQVAIVLVWPFRQVSNVLGLDQPRELLTERLGRDPLQEEGAAPGADEAAPSDDQASTDDVAPGPGVEDALAAAAALAGREAVDPEAVAIPLDLDPEAPALAVAGDLPDRLTATFTDEDPLDVAVVGDSLTEQLGPALIDQAARSTVPTVVTHEFTYSSGLTRPDFFDWPAEAASLAEQLDPDVWVVMLGANDAQDVRDAEGRFQQIGSDEWEAVYERRVGALMDQLTEDGRAVIWIGQPVMRSSEFDNSMRYVSELYEQQAAARPLVSFVNSRRVFDDDQGRYADYLPGATGQLSQMRLSDGIHLTRAGAERLAQQVLPLLPGLPVEPVQE
ncbi:DUF459 domain-containing protein [Euzebya tangerina]|uniref:SGNH/GDSL hydrolase family protein n=1 Tax=Euzebya tangerina TaxID=591198 RepID=UPI000E31A3D0|nr:DUF459 domain-containing protein [Euzebya tangerina]